MRRSLPALSLILLIVTGWLGVLVWQETLARTLLQHQADAQTKSIAELHQRAAERARKAKVVAAAVSPPVDPKLAALDRELADLATERDAARFRLNALNGYVAGFDRLNLPPDTLAAAKKIILDRWRAAEQARKNVHSADDALVAAGRANEVEHAQLEALLGKPAADALEASTRESRIDWEIGTDMWDAGAPLTPEQVQGLALAEVRVGFVRTFWGATPTDTQIADPQTGFSAQDTAFLAASAPLLSPAQQEILRRSLVENNQYNTSMRTFSARQRALWQSSPGGKP